MKRHRQITKFIKNKLVELIRKDLWEYQIGNERDLETAYCFHLRNFLGDDKTWKISTNHTISGKKTSIAKRSSSGKRRRSEFIMPDVTLAKNPSDYDKPLKHKIGIELKLISPATTNLPNIGAEKFMRDYRKLMIIKSRHYMRTVFFFWCFQIQKYQKEKSEEELKKLGQAVELENLKFV